MNADELKAVSEMVANLTTDLYNQIRVAHDRVTALEAWGEQVNGAIAEIVERQAALQSFVVETVSSGVYQSEVTEHYRRFVVDEAARVGVSLAELQKAIKGQAQGDGDGGEGADSGTAAG